MPGHTIAPNNTDSSPNVLVEKYGIMVAEGEVAVSDFAQTFNLKESSNSYYDGSWDEVVALVQTHWDNNEPGTGSVDGDVILVNVPAANFYSPIVKITDENKHLVVTEEKVRREGEKPVLTRYIIGEKPEAKFVQVVVYRADTLDRDDGRSSDAEWEIIAINAQLDKHTPMDPETMKRNNNHDKGGTYREYSDAQWAEAYEYWENHAYIKESE